MNEIVNRWACGAGAIGRLRCFVRFAVGGGLIAAALGPAFGVPVLTLIGAIFPAPDFLPGAVVYLRLEGHRAGTRAVERLVNAIAVNCRSIDTPARIGGDEFCVVLPGADSLMAWNVAERIARALGASGIPRLNAPTQEVMCSSTQLSAAVSS